MTENSFKFKKGDLEISFSGEKTFVEEQIRSWKNFLEKNIVIQAETINNTDIYQISYSNENPEPIRVKKNISIDDFIELKNPENNPDRIIVAAYFLEKYDKYDSFTEIDIYRILNIENIEKYLIINLEKGLISNSGEKNTLPAYTLTYSGEMYVKEGLQF